MIRLALALLLLWAPWPPTPPTVEWALGGDQLIVSWVQGVSGRRCFALEDPPVDYGCVWAWQGPNRVTLPRGGPVAPPSQPEEGDVIAMDGAPLIVPPRPWRLFLPLAL